jgi:hypothetical protein
LWSSAPRLDQSSLAFWQLARNQLYRVNAKDTNGLLIVGMKVGDVMRRFRLGIHPNNNAKESAKFRHENTFDSAFASL